MYSKLKKLVKKFIPINFSHTNNKCLNNDEMNLIEKIREKKLTYLSVKKLTSLSTTCNQIEKQQLPGIFIEAGCALGGSAIMIAKLKKHERPLFVYDVFGMIPPPTEEDTADVHERYQQIVTGNSTGIGGDKYYGYEQNLFERVTSNFNDFEIDLSSASVHLIKGLVQDTMEITDDVAFAHIDVDWYDPVMTCLKRIFPNLVAGGSIILDDYYDWGGCRKAVDEYLLSVPGCYEIDGSAGSLKLTKKAL